MEESTSADSNSNISRGPPIMKYDDAVLNYVDARQQYKDSILKYRKLNIEQEIANLKKLTYADVHQLIPGNSEKEVVPQLLDQNEKREQFTEGVKLEEEDIKQRNQNVRLELGLITRMIACLEEEKKRLA